MLSSRRAPSSPSRVPIVSVLVLAALVIGVLLPAAAAGAASRPPVAAADVAADRLLVRFATGTPAHARAAARHDAGATELESIDQLGVDVWKVPAHAAARALAGLQRNPHVAYAEQDAVVVPDQVVPNDPSWSSQWGPRRVNAPDAWSTSTGAASVVIAVLDSGLNPSTDLRGQVTRGYNAMNGTSDVTDNHGHGTKAASVAAATTDNGADIAAYCWSCSIMPVKVFDTGTSYVSDSARGMTWATDNGADVISYSMSGSSSTTTMLNAVRYATDRGVVVVSSAGNQGSDAPRYPAAYPEVIGVAGTTSSDALYSWSNYGQWVEVSAPGSNHAISPTGTVTTFAGTSSAAPAVSGVVGLGLAAGASGPEVRAALEASVAPLSAIKHGRVDAAGMLARLSTSTTVEPAPEPEPEPAPAPEPEPAPAPDPTIALTVTTSKTKGVNTANLRWTGATGTTVVVDIDGATTTVANDGSFQHRTGTKGNPTIAYRVCDSGACSQQVTVSSW